MSPSGATVYYTVTASGGCSPPPNVVANPPSGSTFPVGMTLVTATAADSCGNSNTCSFYVTVNAPTNPPINLTCSTNITVTATSSNGAVVYFSTPAIGGCSPPPNVMDSPPSGSLFPIGITTVFVTASDNCGQHTNCSFTVTVNAQTNPPIVLSCSTNITVTATSSDGATVFFSTPASGGCSPPPNVVANPPSGSTFPIGTTPVYVTASDSCGDSTNCSFQVTVNAQTNPPINLTCSTNITVTATSSNGAVVSFNVSATGGCNPPPMVIATPPSGSTFPLGTNTVFVTATNSCGQTTNCSFQVIVNSSSNPPIVLTCSTNIAAMATGPSGATVYYSVTASGGCSPPPSLTVTPPSGSTFPIGTNTVTATASDSCGQTNTCSFLVIVTNRPIQLTCSSNITVMASNSNGAVVYYTVTASGGCSPPPSLVVAPPSGSTFRIGTNTVTATASDSCGQTNTCSFLIIVTNPPAVYNLSGYVRGCQTNGSPISQVTVTLSGGATASTMTDTNGFFIFTNLTGGVSYTVTPALAGNAFTPANATVMLNSNTVLETFVGGSGLIQGQVLYSTNGGGVPGITIQLTGGETHTVLTSSNGNYIFTNLPSGNYMVTPVATNGFVFTPTNASITLSATNCVGQTNFTAASRIVLLVALEVNQAIQDWSNSVPLIQNKETIVRAFLQLVNATNPPVLLQTARLYGVGNGGPLPGSPLSPMNSNGVFLVQTTNAALGRSNFVNSVNFRLPHSWLSGPVTLQFVCTNNVTVVPTNVVPANSAVQVVFSPAAVPLVKFFGINWTNIAGAPQTITLARMQDMIARMLATYPSAQIDAQYSVWNLSTNSLRGTNSLLGDGTANAYPSLSKINSALAFVKFLDSLYLPVGNRIYYGALAGLDYTANGPKPRPSYGRAIGIPGPTASGFAPLDPYGWSGDLARPWTLNVGTGRQTHSHEIGHDLGLQHDVSGTNFNYRTYYYVAGPPGKWVESNSVNVISNATTRTVGAQGACSEVGPTNYVYSLFQNVNGQLQPALGPMTNGTNALIFGLDTRTLDTTNLEPVLSPYQYFDLMSYCRNGLEDRWAGTFTYQFLLGTINANFTAPPSPPPLTQVLRWFFIRGQLGVLDGTAEFEPFLQMDLPTTPPGPVAGSYMLELRDGQSNLLQEIPFAPQEGVDEDEDESGQPVPEEFLVAVQASSSIREVQLSDGSNVLADIVGSTNMPSVTTPMLSNTNGGPFNGSGELDINWTGSDADPNARLTYTVQFSADGGNTWETLTTDWQDPDYDLDSQFLPATTQGLVRVLVSDGFNTSQPAVSSPVTILPHPPVLVINTPVNGTLFVADQQITLSAFANDPQDGPLDGASVQWTSSRDGVVGIGDTINFEADALSEGTHVITVTATDSLSLSNSASVTIFVLRNPPPTLSIVDTNQQVLVSWPASVTNYVLESSLSLNPQAWSLVTNPPVIVDLLQTVTLDQSATNRFFRLRLP